MDATDDLAVEYKQRPAGRREKRKQEIRERIEEAAYALFKRHGIDEVSIEQICAGADVARRTFYGHYPNKQALLQAMSQSRVRFTADAMVQRVMQAQADTPARVDAMISYMEENLASYTAVDRALIVMAPGSLDDDSHLREVSDSLRDYLVELFARGQAEGDTSGAFSPALLADMVMGTINTMIVNWAANPDYPITEKLEEARRLFHSVIRA
jgi:AcrR family transcriptional regulator